MKVSKQIESLVAGLAVWLVPLGMMANAETTVDFNHDIRPILARNCFSCHGPDAGSREADLSLHTAEAATQDLGGHRAIDIANPTASVLLSRIESDNPDELMPPPDSGHSLSDDEKEKLRTWIESGAEYEIHWSFTPPQKKALPRVRNQDWPARPLDHFVLAKLENHDLQPEEVADRHRLLRRVSLDLTGLPPTIQEADAFIADNSDAAYQKVVDRLLKSSAFGEHWARLWLDLARYADTKGYEKDRPREMWRFRDWVIDAFNDDMPFDQFTIEQLAGDLLPSPTSDQLLATAFHRNTMTNEEGGTDDEEFRIAAVKDRVDTTLQVWMGLTMGCAKCHSHKFDPISQTDYYSFFAFFNQTQDRDRGDESPVRPTPTKQQQRQLANLERFAKDSEADSRLADATYAYEQAKELTASFQKTPVMLELAEKQQRKTHMHKRGNFLDKGEQVAPRVLELFGHLPQSAPENRLGVAQWIVSKDNPLTSRVMVNRIWARLFGVGLVETEEDFGTQGTAPSHPDLLDWLAVDFSENRWSIKHLLRSIVLSSTYQQAGVLTPTKLERDPNNRLLSRGPRFRLSAETVRDQALAVSKLLSPKIGGRSVMPPQPEGVWKTTYSSLSWKDATGDDRYRRGLYTYWKRTSPYPAMTTFDAGSGEVCQIRRVRTNTPLQALVTLNDTAFVEAAGALASQMQKTSGDLEAKLAMGFRLTLTRPPAKLEMARLVELHAALKKDFAADPTSGTELAKAAGVEAVDASMIVIANVLLNLDETLMKP